MHVFENLNKYESFMCESNTTLILIFYANHLHTMVFGSETEEWCTQFHPTTEQPHTHWKIRHLKNQDTSTITTSTTSWCNSMHAKNIQNASQCARHALVLVSCWSVLRYRVTLPPHVSKQTLTFGQKNLPSTGWPRGYQTSVAIISYDYSFKICGSDPFW